MSALPSGRFVWSRAAFVAGTGSSEACGVHKPDRSCGHAVFVDQPAEPIAPSQMLFAVRGGELVRRSIVLRRCEAERAMRPMSVVVVRESAEGAFELAAARDQQPIEALSTDGTDEALGDGVRLRRSERRPDDLESLGSEDLVEGASELAVSIVDQEAQRRSALLQ